MSSRNRSLEDRIEELERQLGVLQKRVDALGRKNAPGAVTTSSPLEDRSEQAEDTSEKVLAWVGRSSLLQRLATVCFLLVVALVLRTLTDSGVMAKDLGSWLGMFYAFALIGAGWFGYRRQHPLAPVFTVIGTLLVYSIVVETHEHFESLSTLPAYLILAAAAAMTGAISHLYRVALPVFVGALGMGLAGVALDFPNPVFPYLVVLLIAANLLGTFATRLQRCSWLRWLLFLLTIFMAQVWGFRLGISLGRGGGEELPFSLLGFFPAVVVMAGSYLGIALFGILGRITEKISKFDYILPTLNVLWAFIVARYVVNSGLGNELFLGLSGLAAAVIHLVVAFWLGRRRVKEGAGANSFIIAGSVLLMLALPVATGSRMLSLAVLSALAVGLAVLAYRWKSGGMRAFSYLLQIYVCATLALYLRSVEGTAPSLVGAGASAVLSCLAFFHYLWARNNPPPSESRVFKRFDPDDRSAVLLLMASLVGAFFALRVGVYQGLDRFMAGGDPSMAFSSAQSVLINGAAVVLMCYAFARRNKEVRNVAILLTVIGGGKVFLIDLFGMRGVPVVVSVLSFGVAASLESFALTRWQRIDHLRYSKWPREEAGETERSGEGTLPD